jgi:hypothetical protein
VGGFLGWGIFCMGVPLSVWVARDLRVLGSRATAAISADPSHLSLHV